MNDALPPAAAPALTDAECDEIILRVDRYSLPQTSDRWVHLRRALIRAGYAARPAAAEPVAWICDDDWHRLREHGCATVYEHEQRFTLMAPVGQTPLYASPPAAEPPPREPTLTMLEAALAVSRRHGALSSDGLNIMPIGYELAAATIVWRAMYDASAAEAKEPK